MPRETPGRRACSRPARRQPCGAGVERGACPRRPLGRSAQARWCRPGCKPPGGDGPGIWVPPCVAEAQGSFRQGPGLGGDAGRAPSPAGDTLPHLAVGKATYVATHTTPHIKAISRCEQRQHCVGRCAGQRGSARPPEAARRELSDLCHAVLQAGRGCQVQRGCVGIRQGPWRTLQLSSLQTRLCLIPRQAPRHTFPVMNPLIRA